MCSHHLPSVIPLFVSQKSPSSIDIRGEDIQTIDDLPSILWGARLDASSFVCKDAGSSSSRATESWSAIWKTPDEEDVLKLSWNLSTGWAITYAHQDKEILSVQGKAHVQLSEVVGAHHAAFADALAQQLWNIDSRWADKLDNGKRSGKGDPECRMDLLIPVCTTSVLSAVKAVAELVSAFEETAPTAFIELHPVLGVWREAGSDYWRVLRRNWNATGLPSYGPPKFNGDEITILRYVLALHVRVPLARVIAAHARLMETLAETVAQGLEAGLPGPMLVPVCVGAEDCKYEQCVNGMRHEWLPIPLKGGIDRLLEDKETGTCLQELVAADLAASKGIFAYFVDKPTLERRLFTEEMAQACLAEVQRMKRQRPKAAEPEIEIDEAALEAASPP